MRARVLSTLAALTLTVTTPIAADELAPAPILELSAIELRDALASGRISAERVVAAYLERIGELDDAGPRLAAIIEMNPEALSIARALDLRRARGGTLGALHGVPVLLKGNIDTRDRLATSAGSLALQRHHASTDAEVARLLREAGAVILGKTNLSEWANFRSANSTSGWSSVRGQTRNPYVLDRNPCGSSSGSAVAVAARLAPLAIGTETDGSIVCPAATNGVVGIKPTRGLVGGAGIVPIAASQDTAGPFARTAADAALLLAVLAPAWNDTGRAGAHKRVLRVGVLRDYVGAGQELAVERNLATVVGWLRDSGVEIVDPIRASPGARVRQAEFAVLLSEFRAGIGRYLDGVRYGPRSLDELIAFNLAHEADVMPYFGQDLLLAARYADIIESPAIAAARSALADYEQNIAELFQSKRLDALLAPANARAWVTDERAGDRFTVGSSSLAAITGYPSVAMPTVLAGELPLGVVLVGRPHDESLMLELATRVERRRGAFPPPRFLPTVADSAELALLPVSHP